MIEDKTSMPVDLHVGASYASRSGRLVCYCLKPSVNDALVQLTPHCRPAPRFHCDQDPHLRCCPKSLLDTLYIYIR